MIIYQNVDNYNRDHKKFFFWTTLVLEHPYLNIPCFSGSFAVSSYCSTPDGLKLIQLAVEKSDIERISSNKTSPSVSLFDVWNDSFPPPPPPPPPPHSPPQAVS